MSRYFLTLLITLHGLIHLMGFAKAFQYAKLENLTMPISKPFGILWMLTAFIFVTSAVILLLRKNYWWMITIPAIIISQVVITASWNDAKLGTVANAIIVAAIIFNWGTTRIQHTPHVRSQRTLHKQHA